MSNFVKSFFLVSILSVLILIFVGCGQSASGRVSGIVMLDEKPLANATVTFYPTEPGSPAVGMTDKNGHYELAVSHSVKGAIPGNYKVTISTARSEQPDYSSKEIKIISAIPEYVPEKLTNQVTTNLIKEIKSGKQKINFALTSTQTNETAPTQNNKSTSD
ncbi:MAG: carboxypeptidase-like regulatory domain-containing protein [Planctomycetaceae bacterium]|jgi:hypothetical protein|nr:carboxypeptidase-like regulatory domain-containing protein [Planctomycetaceae bacterium]